MKAIVRHTYGPPDVLHLEDVPLPALRDGDLLVRVHEGSANAGDWHLLRGTPLPLRLVAGLRCRSPGSHAPAGLTPETDRMPIDEGIKKALPDQKIR